MPSVTDSELCFLTGCELARAIRNGTVTSAHALEVLVKRVQALNAPINAIILYDLERARARAIEADAALGRGEVWGPFHGVPITVKENNDVGGLPTTSGNLTHADVIAPVCLFCLLLYLNV
jgi:amidase